MKNLCLLFCFSFLFAHATLFGQSFQKGNVNLDLGVGVAIHQTTVSLTFEAPGSGGSGGSGGSFTLSEDDDAASVIVPISLEYGLTDRIGIGAELAFVDYFIDNEDSTETTDRVNSIDFSVLVNYHLLRSEKNDLMIGATFGGSAVGWQFLDGDELDGTGGRFSIYLKDRLLLGEHIGLLFRLGYIGYTYDEISASDSNAILESLDWTLSGWHLGTGLAVKF